ncbi:MAG: TonB-dependent receptor [Candidatus Latescibacteria bacterium]|nr:TonB-dependent receptor [Candidatus Latescibacterota bacterium]
MPTFRQLAAGVVAQRLIAGGTPPDQAQARARQQADTLAAQFERIVPRALPGLRNAMAVLNPQTRGFDPVPDSGVADIPKIRPTITKTFELGYKGVVQNKVLITVDLYRTETEDFVGPLRVETPNVFLDAGALSPPLSGAFGRALQDTSAAQLSEVLAASGCPPAGRGRKRHARG